MRVLWAVIVGVGLQLWAAWNWPGNFTSDEAVIGLMARHILRGDVPLYMYGQSYLGSVDAILGAFSIWLFGSSVVALRLPAILLFGVWLGLFAVFVRRWFGDGAAVATTLVLAVSGVWMLSPSILVVPVAAMSILGTVVLLGERRFQEPSLRRVPDTVLCAAAAGLGAWVYPTATMYVPAVAAAALWRRRGRVGRHLAPLALGVAIGTSPMWIGWLVFGIPTSWPMSTAGAADVPGRLRSLGELLLPTMWGTFELGRLFRSSPLSIAAGSALVVISLVAVGRFLWVYRAGLWSLVRWAPPGRGAEGQVGGVLVVLLFLVPLVLVTLVSRGSGTMYSRYLLVAWPANAVMLGTLAAAVAGRQRFAGAGLAVLWLALAGAQGVRSVYASWREGPRVGREEVAALAEFLDREGVRAGYADYRDAYRIDFLSGERLTICPYNGVARYGPYEEAARREAVQAYLLRPGQVSAGRSGRRTMGSDPNEETSRDQPPFSGARTLPVDAVEDMMEALELEGLSGPPFEHVKAQTRRMVVRTRREVGGWDVWILEKDRGDGRLF
jgi:hypothetical protein